MRGRAIAVAFSVAVVAGCASVDIERVPLCGELASLQPLPDAEVCEAAELEAFEYELLERIVERDRALVRVEFDDGSRLRSMCVVDRGVGSDAWHARRHIAEKVDAIFALPPGPACAAGRRLDLNRYEAALAKLRDREARCDQQTRITRETHGETRVRDRTAGGAYGVYDREYDHCMEYEADWIALDAPGSTRPWIYVKPEVSDPPGPPASETTSRCFRKSRDFEKRASCIESDGWERLEPPRR